jgi:hypothetical protein
MKAMQDESATYVRVLARCINEERLDDILHFDLRLVAYRVADRYPVLGWQTGLGESKPVVVSSDGRVDFGTAYDPQRFGNTDLLGIEIRLGSEIRWWGHGYNESYKICAIKCLLDLV